MLVYRITHKNYSKELSAAALRGRWNTSGKKVIYCAESIPLAFLENMVRRQGAGFNDDFKIMIIEIPDNLKITVINVPDLADGWRDFEDYSKCQPFGDQWYEEGKTTVLKVPSAVLPDCSNYLLNTVHADFRRIQLIETTNLIPDPRIEDILKRYPGK